MCDTDTGLKDENGDKIHDGDFVSLDGKRTTDDSVGLLPNGWTFGEEDVYEVYFDDRIGNWSLKLGVALVSDYNCKYMNHALSLLHGGNCVKVVGPPR